MDGAVTIATITEFITTILASVTTWFGSVFDFITSNPLAMFGVLAPIAFVLVPKGLGLIKKMLNKRKI